MATTYEWDVEEIDEHGDIIDHNFGDKLTDVFGIEGELVLVRYGYDKAWAYVKDGKLPERFTDAYDNETVKVPLKFHRELSKANQRKGA